MQVPSKADFLAQTSGGRRMPVYRDVLADMETPLSAYWKLAHDEPFSFLLESVTGGEQLARYSILGVRPRCVLRCKGRTARRLAVKEDSRFELPEGRDPLHLLEQELVGRDTVMPPGMPKFAGGAVGFLSYDFVRYLEKLPDTQNDDLKLDDMAMMIADTVVVFDHARNLIRILVLCEGSGEAYERACAEIERVVASLRRPLPTLPASRLAAQAPLQNMDQDTFEEGVCAAKDYIRQGDAIQIVLSQRFSTRMDAHPVSVYRALRSLNPSPYMFLLRFGDLDLVGASPELHVGLQGGLAHVRPIAGTRWRGSTPAEDEALAAELLADEKERAEHIMLVDLGRNDLGRVSEIGSVQVNELMVVERYSHVMHIVSDVTGRLAKNKSPYDLLRASFPAGTVSGAPKVRAMQIIDELEPTRRGCYAGAIGYISSTGDLDTCIAIRTILIKDGVAHVQVGAGIVHDSDPAREYEETLNKARACLKAIEMAQTGSLSS